MMPSPKNTGEGFSQPIEWIFSGQIIQIPKKYQLFIIISVKKPYIIIPVKNEAPVRFL